MLSLAYSKSKTTVSQGCRDSRGSMVTNPSSDGGVYLREFSASAKMNYQRWLFGKLSVGTRVLIGHAVGTVVGYNIAGFGMWPGSTHPLIVRHPDGRTLRCRLTEITVLPDLSMSRDA